MKTWATLISSNAFNPTAEREETTARQVTAGLRKTQEQHRQLSCRRPPPTPRAWLCARPQGYRTSSTTSGGAAVQCLESRRFLTLNHASCAPSDGNSRQTDGPRRESVARGAAP